MTLYGIPADYFRLLSLKEVEAIHKASLRVLEEAGYLVEHDRALELLAEAGCQVDFKTKNVKVPQALLMDTVKKAPARIKLCGRDPQNDLVIEPNTIFFSNGGTAIKIYDFATGERRDTTLEDVATIARMVDALDNIHMIHLPCYPHDCDKEEVDVNRYFNAINNSTKHIMGGVYKHPGKVIKLAQKIAGGEEALRERPFISMICCGISPLRMEYNYIDFMFEIVNAGIPLVTSNCPISGLTAPMTLAGHLVQINAEALFGVFFAQILKSGTPVFYSVVPTIADMRTTGFLFGAIENGIMNAACSQLATFYNLPLYSTGGISEAKIADAQAGYEKAMGTLLATLAGGQLIHNTAGLLDGSITFSLEQLVIDNEINGMALRAAQGIEVNEETMAEEVIKSVGSHGNYLSQMHTVKHMRSETFFPRLANRMSYSDWVKEGSKDIAQKAHDVAAELLQNHQPTRVPSEIVKELQKEFPELRVC